MEHALTISVLAVLVTMALALIRALMGPSAYNRMLAANMFGTKTVLLVALGGLLLEWPSFVDIMLLYAMVNFVVTVAVMRFFEYGESAESSERAEVAGGLHPWIRESLEGGVPGGAAHPPDPAPDGGGSGCSVRVRPPEEGADP